MKRKKVFFVFLFFYIIFDPTGKWRNSHFDSDKWFAITFPVSKINTPKVPDRKWFFQLIRPESSVVLSDRLGLPEFFFFSRGTAFFFSSWILRFRFKSLFSPRLNKWTLLRPSAYNTGGYAVKTHQKSTFKHIFQPKSSTILHYNNNWQNTVRQQITQPLIRFASGPAW